MHSIKLTKTVSSLEKTMTSDSVIYCCRTNKRKIIVSYVLTCLTIKHVCILFYFWIYIQGVSGGRVNVLGGGSMDDSE